MRTANHTKWKLNCLTRVASRQFSAVQRLLSADFALRRGERGHFSLRWLSLMDNQRFVDKSVNKILFAFFHMNNGMAVGISRSCRAECPAALRKRMRSSWFHGKQRN